MASLLLAIIYLGFISLGLPDSLLGSAWPVMYQEIGVPVSWGGIVSMIISVGTVVSSLNADRVHRLLGTGKVTAISVAMTAAGLFGFSLSHSFAALCLCAIPYGLGAGSIDAALNNYVALHYASRHMSWLHCMWGVGASVGPAIMGAALTGGYGWSSGYRWIGLIQLALTVLLFLSLPLWKSTEKKAEPENSGEKKTKPLSIAQAVGLKGAKEVLVCFFCYCALETTVGLWASTYLVRARGVDEVTAARLASLFFLGITVGRALSGFVTLKLNDTQMIRLGLGIVGAGLLCVLLPLGNALVFGGLVAIGLGCAPIYPSIIHSTPAHFGEDKSQAMIGMQMASAYMGSSFMPPLFGWLSSRTTIGLFPWYLLLFLVLMIFCHELLCRKTADRHA